MTRGYLFVPKDVNRKFPLPPPHLPFSHVYGFVGSRITSDAIGLAAQWNALGAVSGDSFSVWVENIAALRFYLDVWEAISSKDTKRLRELASFDEAAKPQWVDFHSPPGVPRQSIHIGTDRTKPSLLDAAERLLFDVLEQYLAPTVRIGLRTENPDNRGKLIIKPRSLRDAIWVQFALAVIGKKPFRTCEACGRSFEVSPQIARTNRRLCSRGCKARAHRNRHALALRLASQGMKVKQISKETGSQVSTVKKWLAERK